MRLRLALALRAAASSSWPLLGRSRPRRASSRRRPRTGDVRILPVRGNIWLLSAGGSQHRRVDRQGRRHARRHGPGADDRRSCSRRSRTSSRQVTGDAHAAEVVRRRRRRLFVVEQLDVPADDRRAAGAKPIVGIVNTSFDADAHGRQRALSARRAAATSASQPQDAWIMAHEKATLHLTKAIVGAVGGDAERSLRRARASS